MLDLFLFHNMWLTARVVRYNEWGLASWMLQYKYLRTPKGEDWRYLSYNSEEDAENANLNDLRNVVLGRMMTATSSATFVCIKICTK